MDFRRVDPHDVAWVMTARGTPKPLSKVVAQTPSAPCRVSLLKPGMYRIELRVQASPILREFCDWVCELEDSASDHEALKDWKAGKARSPAVFKGSMRLTVFMDTPVFDATGKMSADLMDAASCACLVELQGCWCTEDKWGLRWTVKQVKFDTQPVDAVDAVPTCTTVGPPGPSTVADFAFLD